MSSNRKAFAGGAKVRSQHSIFGPAKRIAGPPGGAPRWADSLLKSWNRYELRDIIRREKGKSYFDEHGRVLPLIGEPRRLNAADIAAAAAA